VRRGKLEMQARRATPAGRVERAVKGERVEKVRMPPVQQENTAIQTRRLENRSASGIKVHRIKPKSENKFGTNPRPIERRRIVALGNMEFGNQRMVDKFIELRVSSSLPGSYHLARFL
jgi:hypothetical protein